MFIPFLHTISKQKYNKVGNYGFIEVFIIFKSLKGNSIN